MVPSNSFNLSSSSQAYSPSLERYTDSFKGEKRVDALTQQVISRIYDLIARDYNESDDNLTIANFRKKILTVQSQMANLDPKIAASCHQILAAVDQQISQELTTNLSFNHIIHRIGGYHLRKAFIMNAMREDDPCYLFSNDFEEKEKLI